MNNKATKNTAATAIIAALYTALTLLVAPLSFGPVQIRLSEALTSIAAVCPPAVWGLTLGCFISNAIGAIMGTNPLGLIDCVVGTAATLLAAVFTYLIGKYIKNEKLVVLLSPLPPIVFNAVFIGTELCFIVLGSPSILKMLVCMAYVALGEAVACFLGSTLLLKNFKKYFIKYF